MSEPIQHGGEWWSRAADGSWLRWNATDYRWDPQPGAPPFPEDVAEPAPQPPGPAAGAASPAWPATPGLAQPSPPPPASPEPASQQLAPQSTPSGGSAALAQQLRDFESADGKGRAAMALIGLTLASGLVTAPLLFHRAGSENAIFRDNPFLAGMSTFSLFALLGAGIATIVWLKGVYDNSPALGARDLRYTPGWAIGAWFIPVGNFFIPKQIADDVWRASDPALPADLGAHWKFKPVPPRLHFWWGTWLGTGALTVVASGMIENALEEFDIPAYRNGLRVEAVSDVLMVIAGLLFITIIRDVSSRQRERARMLESQTRGEAGPAPQGVTPG